MVSLNTQGVRKRPHAEKLINILSFHIQTVRYTAVVDVFNSNQVYQFFKHLAKNNIKCFQISAGDPTEWKIGIYKSRTKVCSV